MQIASFLRDEAEEMFDRIDENGDQRINFDEYAALMLEMDHTRSAADVRSGFDAIDTDRDGLVSFDEFYAWLTR
jgi:Ca2+-binding EF-hand superfamily protein